MSKVSTVLTDKPFFEVRLKANSIQYGIMINGMMIYTDFKGEGQMATALPVNLQMKDGENVMELGVLPNMKGQPFSPGQSITAELWVKSANSELQGEYRIASVQFEGNDKLWLEEDQLPDEVRLDSRNEFLASEHGDVVVRHEVSTPMDVFEGAFYVPVRMEIPNALPRWALWDSDKIPQDTFLEQEKYDKLESELLAEYLKIQRALEDGSEAAIDAIMPLFEERNRETELALYMTPGRMAELLRGDFLDAANKEKYDLLELTVEYIGATVEENNLLISLKRTENDPAIVLNYREFSGCNMFDILYRRQNGKWIICR